MQPQKWQNDLSSSPRKDIQYHRIQVYAATTNAEEGEVDQFYEDLEDLLELTPKKGVLFIIGDLHFRNTLGETCTQLCKIN